MIIIPSKYTKTSNLPLKLKISFEAIFEYLENISKNKKHPLYNSAIQMLEEYKKYPILKEGFEDYSYLEKYNTEIDGLLDFLFPELLQNNEIKAVSIPFDFTTFKLSKRFQGILKNAGNDYEFKIRNYDESNIYILSCTLILAYCYNVNINFKRPFYFDIPDSKTGVIKHYRTMFNGDFLKITPLENAKPITNDDVQTLLDNFDNIEVWKEKFPPNSYELKGFGIMNLFDVTADQSLSKLKENLISKDDKSIEAVERSISNLFDSSDIKFGFSIYNFNNEKITSIYNSFIILNKADLTCQNIFCNEIKSKVFTKKEVLAISDIERYGQNNNYNGLYQVLKKQGVQSILLIPLILNRDMIGIMELSSKKKYELNSVNAYKLNDVIPVFKIAIKRYMEEFENKLESIIQENYTALHPTVKWKFYEEAEEYLFNSEIEEANNLTLKDIVFEDVIPLYGQSDIKGSSIARNNAIQEDLITQLNLASKIIVKADKLYKLPIYKDLLFRIKKCHKNIKEGLNSGDEVALTTFLNKEIYPVFNHLKNLDSSLKTDIDEYMQQIDDKIHVVYDKRRKFETSVNKLNYELAKFIDAKQDDAQKMFPHYFERYKTDGVDYNMYIGQSLVRNRPYNSIYLYNLRLWQLQMMCELERIAYDLKNKLPHPLEIASLILVHSNPISIKFRMDEKRFDVDGAYNVRYEIIKKRIDKAFIKNTEERLTQPGKIAIVYGQNKDAEEYLKYIKYLQSNNYLLDEVEHLDIEDLQGISGLKALRVSVNYTSKQENNISIDEIMEMINNENLN